MEDLRGYSEWIYNILNEKFGNIIMKSSYNYYSTKIKEKTNILLKEIGKKWEDAYTNLFLDVQVNFTQIKYTFYELIMMAQNYETIMKTNLIINYFYSIELFQKTEFNYTIISYYDYFY